MFKKKDKARIYFRKLEFSDFWDRDFMNLIKCEIATLRKWLIDDVRVNHVVLKK